MSNENFKFKINKSNEKDILIHLTQVDSDFIPALSSRIDLSNYSAKLFNYSTRYECWANDILIGLVCTYYRNDEVNSVYVTNVSTIREYSRNGISINLMNQMLKNAQLRNANKVELHVGEFNIKALELYKKLNFKIISVENQLIKMVKELEPCSKC